MNTILVIDDDPAVVQVISDILHEEGYAVAAARDGLEGLRKATRQPPDLILCDERMPSLAGHEVCQKLFSDPQTRAIPVVMMSAHSYEVMPGTPNCLMFLRKPFQYQTLVNTVEDVIGA